MSAADACIRRMFAGWFPDRQRRQWFSADGFQWEPITPSELDALDVALALARPSFEGETP